MNKPVNGAGRNGRLAAIFGVFALLGVVAFTSACSSDSAAEPQPSAAASGEAGIGNPDPDAALQSGDNAALDPGAAAGAGAGAGSTGGTGQQGGAPIVVPGGSIPSPAATLPAPPMPPSDPGVTTDSPVVLEQWIPPDVTMSGIAVAVSGTKFSSGQTVQIAAQAAPELTGFTCYILEALPDGSIVAVATGTVGADGRFTIGYKPNNSAKIITAVAQAGVKPTDPFNIDDVVARSGVVDLIRK